MRESANLEAMFEVNADGVEILKVKTFPHLTINEFLEPFPGIDFEALLQGPPYGEGFLLCFFVNIFDAQKGEPGIFLVFFFGVFVGSICFFGWLSKKT